MKSKAIQVIQYFLFLSIGVLLSYYFFRNFEFNELKENIKTGNFSWFYLVMLVSLMVYIIRTLRWQMLIRAMGYSTKFHNAFAALSISYFVSFVIPRLGEVTRCLSLKKQHDIPFMELLGTVIIERIIDVITLVILLLLTLVLQFREIMEYVKTTVFYPLYNLIFLKIKNGNITLLFVIIAFVVILAFLIYHFRKYILRKSPRLLVQFAEGLKQGITSIAKLKQKKLFIVYTVCIWICYYLMTYFWFFVFPQTSVLTIGACLSILSIGTIGRSIPVQGAGMGTYHFFVTGVCMLYGLSQEWGKTLATVIHLGQSLFTLAIGIVGLIIFFAVYWKNKGKNNL